MNDSRDVADRTRLGSTVFTLLKAARVLEDRLETALGKVGLSRAKYSVLTALVSAHEPLTLSELAAQLSCVRSNMTQLVDRLEADGLVNRVDDPDDRRSVRAELTTLGKERQRAGEKVIKRVQAEFAASLTTRERTALEAA